MRVFVPLLCLMFFGLQYRIWVGEGSLAEVWQLDKAIESQQVLNVELQERNDKLYAEVINLRDGLEAVEERARRELGMIHRNESFYQVIGD